MVRAKSGKPRNFWIFPVSPKATKGARVKRSDTHSANRQDNAKTLGKGLPLRHIAGQ
jgi:hypothetical protein